MQENRLIQYCTRISTRNRIVCGTILFLAVAIAYLTWDDVTSSGWIFLFVMLSGCLLFALRKWNSSTREMMDDLHVRYPTLEHSLTLLNIDKKSLNRLENLQMDKLHEALKQEKWTLPSPVPITLFGVASAAAALCIIPFIFSGSSVVSNESLRPFVPQEKIKNNQSASFDITHIDITPPSYTGQRGSRSELYDLKVPEGSLIQWHLEYEGDVDSIKVNFQPTDSRHHVEGSTYQRKVVENEFYEWTCYTQDTQLISPLSSIESIPDQSPQVSIVGIEEYTRLPWKKEYPIKFNIEASDDYGLDDAYLTATVAKGSGESVKFRERQFKIKDLRKNSRAMEASYSFNTADLDMEPGNELYFYVMVKDNCPFRIQVTKSTTHFIILEDTATINYIADDGMQVDLMPDFFRSQRQLIIDTEKLIKEKGVIEKNEFNRRSNELGFDQKMLRLRYGQFLGEEEESGIAIENEIEGEDDEHDHDHEYDHDHGSEEKIADWSQTVLEQFGHNHDHEAEENALLENDDPSKVDAARPAWVEALSHNHDNQDENTYFEVSIKTTLKAALSVMWDAELHLRLYDPKKSLPYQYQALKHLEVIRNHARVYVHRIGFDPPPIKEGEKRLTGDLDEITQPRESYHFDPKESYQNLIELTNVLDVLSIENRRLSNIEKQLWSSAMTDLAALTLKKLEWLPVLSMLRKGEKTINNLTVGKINQLRLSLKEIIPQEQNSVENSPPSFHPINQLALQAIETNR